MRGDGNDKEGDGSGVKTVGEYSVGNDEEECFTVVSQSLPVSRESANTDEDFDSFNGGVNLYGSDKHWDFNTCNGYFKDQDHPARLRFNCRSLDFTYDRNEISEVYIKDPKVRKMTRNWQLGLQMHRHMSSCFKYCKPCTTKKICRYDMPKEEETEVSIAEAEVQSSSKNTSKKRQRQRQQQHQGENIHDQTKETLHNKKFKLIKGQCMIEHKYDYCQRKQIRVHAPRNNGNINAHPKSPLLCLCCRGNSDLKYIDNTYGAQEYCCKYSSKADAPDFTIVQNIIVRKLADYSIANATFGDAYQKKLGVIMNAIVAGQQVGAPHACTVLLKLDFVKSSRPTKNVNTKRKSDLSTTHIELNIEELQQMNPGDSVEDMSPKCVVGTRIAYTDMCKLLEKMPNGPAILAKFTFYAFVSAYNVKKQTVELKPNSTIKMDFIEPFSYDIKGLIIGAKSFVHNEVTRGTTLCLYLYTWLYIIVLCQYNTLKIILTTKSKYFAHLSYRYTTLHQQRDPSYACFPISL